MSAESQVLQIPLSSNLAIFMCLHVFVTNQEPPVALSDAKQLGDDRHIFNVPLL